MRKNYTWTAFDVDNRNDFVDAIGKEVFFVYHEKSPGEIIPLLKEGIKEGKRFLARKINAGIQVAVASINERFSDVKREDEMSDELKYANRRAQQLIQDIGVALTDYYFMEIEPPSASKGGTYGFLYFKYWSCTLDTLIYDGKKINAVYVLDRNKKVNRTCNCCGSKIPSDLIFSFSKSKVKHIYPKCGNTIYNLFPMNSLRFKRGKIDFSI